MGIRKVYPGCVPSQLVKTLPLRRPASVTWPFHPGDRLVSQSLERMPGTQAGRSSKGEMDDPSRCGITPLGALPHSTLSASSAVSSVLLVPSLFLSSPSFLLSLSFPLLWLPLPSPGFPKFCGRCVWETCLLSRSRSQRWGCTPYPADSRISPEWPHLSVHCPSCPLYS